MKWGMHNVRPSQSGDEDYREVAIRHYRRITHSESSTLFFLLKLYSGILVCHSTNVVCKCCS